MNPMDSIDAKFMRRALQLASGGEGRVAPNPLVGAVLTARGRIIGEGFHRTCGQPHAEVNAIASVKDTDRILLREATLYVTLEPCSHYGKTPPCAKLIIDSGIPRVVVGAPDPNPLVAGRGIGMLREAGVEVTEGVLLQEALDINKRFMTAHTHRRPWVQLKWAQSADGFMAAFDEDGNPARATFSTPLSKVWMHRERASAQAILVGNNTRAIDRPQLNVRLWAGKDPEVVDLPHDADLRLLLEQLFQRGIHSLMVEGGPTLLRSFIKEGLFDEIRIETNPAALGKGLPAPQLPQGLTARAAFRCDGNTVATYSP